MILHTLAGRAHELAERDILLNDPVLPGEYNPHNVRLWIIGHEYGPIVALWASCEQDAFDEMLDQGYEHFLVQPEDVDPELEETYAYLGNVGEPCDLNYAWISEIAFDPARDLKLIIAIAEGRGAGNTNLEN